MHHTQEGGVNDVRGLVDLFIHLVPPDREDLDEDGRGDDEEDGDEAVAIEAVQEVGNGQDDIYERDRLVTLFSTDLPMTYPKRCRRCT